MRKITILGAFLAITIASHVLASDEKDSDADLIQPPAILSLKSVPDHFGQYVSVTFGNGRGSEGGSMQWRAFEVRIGSSIAPNKRLDFVHYNEGHPDNNHRDGFALQPMYDISIDKNVKLEVGVGPYLSFNTTTQNQIQYNDKRIGILASAVALYYLNTMKNRDLHVRVDYNHVTMPGAPYSDAILVGMGVNFGEHEPSEIFQESLGKTTQITVMGINFKTNRNSTDAALGGQIEIKQYEGEHLALSLSWIQEGEDTLVERSGADAQVWCIWPITESLALSAGVGPYLAQNRLSHNIDMEGLISIDAEQEIGDLSNGLGLLFRFSRIVTDDDIDRDMFAIGVAKRF